MRIESNSFVVFPIGEKRFATPAVVVSELAQPDTPQIFPHTTPLLTGVLVRRGRIIPVCDVAQVLVGPHAPARRFYLIATRRSESELIAVPVTGDCELVTADMLPPADGLPHYVTGFIDVQGTRIEVVDVEQIMIAVVKRGMTVPRKAEVPA